MSKHPVKPGFLNTNTIQMKRFLNFFILAMLLNVFLSATAQELKTDTVMHEKILGLRTCAYKVTDLDMAKKWYADAFGVKPYFDEPFYVGFNIGGYELGLLPSEEKAPEGAENILTYWGVENVQEVFDAFLKLGAEPHEEPHSVGEPLVVASVRDPWGNVIGFIYNPVFSIE